MPVSPSRSRGPKAAPPAERPRTLWPLGLIGIAAVSAVIIATLPASLIVHFLPPFVHAEDFSGSVWHGSAGKLIVNARDAGALEWRLHPRALLGLAMAADLHWVKTGFELDGTVRMDRREIAADHIQGEGPIEDLRDFGVPAGWRGTVSIKSIEIKSDYSSILSAAGDIQVTNLASARVAGGANLGGYDLSFPQDAISPDGTATANLADRGGPLQILALIRLSAKTRTATLSGTVMARAEASPAVRSELDNLSQLRGRDSQGRIPLEVEFTF